MILIIFRVRTITRIFFEMHMSRVLFRTAVKSIFIMIGSNIPKAYLENILNFSQAAKCVSSKSL